MIKSTENRGGGSGEAPNVWEVLSNYERPDSADKAIEAETSDNEGASEPEHRAVVEAARQDLLDYYNNNASAAEAGSESIVETDYPEYEQYKQAWEDEKAAADRRGVNPETGLYEKGLTPVSDEARTEYDKKKALMEKYYRGEKLSIFETIALRDAPVRKIGDYELKKDCCYRKIDKETLEEYKRLGYVGRDPKTLGTKDFGKVKGGNPLTVDWYLGASTTRYGDILIEVPAKAEYFVPADEPGENLGSDPDALHMYSSSLVEPIPFSEVKVLGAD